MRKRLDDLAKAQQIAILLDRRIDPQHSVDLFAGRGTFDDLLAQIAEKIEGGVAWLGPLAYIGPHDAARRLRTLAALRAADGRSLPKEKRSAFERAEAWQWENLAEPRALLSDLAAKAHVELEGLELVPHDLWPAADLPALTWIDRFTLVANEFDLTFEFTDASHVRLLPVVAPVVIEQSYPGGGHAKELASSWKRLAPDAEIAIVGGKLVVRGRLEDHELLRPAKSAPPPATKPGGQVYTLTVPDLPLSAVIEKLRQSSIDIRVDEAALKNADLTLDRRVSFSVERASLEELLEAALKPAGLTFRREGNAYKIVPRQSAANVPR
ncbi:MAG: STN domain-containing protein [Pirellulales bacterium]